MNDTQLLTRLAEANAYGKEAPLPETIWTSELALREIERRMGMKPTESPDQPTVTSDQQQQEAAPPPSAPDQVLNAPGQRTSPRRQRSLLVGVAAFAAVVFVGVAAWGIVAVVGDDATSPVAAPTATAAPVTTQPPTTTTVPALTVDEALAVSSDYIDAFNSGDADAVLGLFTSNVALSEWYIGMTFSFEAIDRGFFEQALAWSIAQGSTFVSPECAVIEEGAAAAVTVSCEFGWLDAAEKAVGAPPVPTVLTMVVTPDGISQAAFEYPPEFGLDSFDRWVGDNHSDNSEFVEFRDWDSVADAEQGGTLRALYVAEWAAFLEANDCTYQRSVCRPTDQ